MRRFGREREKRDSSVIHLVVGGRRRRLVVAALHGGRAAVGGGRSALHVLLVLLVLPQDRPVERVVVLVVHRAEQDAEQLGGEEFLAKILDDIVILVQYERRPGRKCRRIDSSSCETSEWLC